MLARARPGLTALALFFAVGVAADRIARVARALTCAADKEPSSGGQVVLIFSLR